MTSNEQVKNSCESCKYKIDKHFSHFQVQIAESAKYTSTIITVAYISLLSIMGQIHSCLNKSILVIFAFFLIISILLFIITEIWTMMLRTKHNSIREDAWTHFFDHKIKFEDLNKEIYQKDQLVRKTFKKYYEFLFYGSLLSGLIATGVILVWSIIYLLTINA